MSSEIEDVILPGGWRLDTTKCIGGGAFGKVYHAFNDKTGILRAVKRVDLQRLPPEELDSVKREVELLAQLNSDRIVKYHGSSEDGKYLYIIMELVTGTTVAQHHKKVADPVSGRVNLDLVRRVIYQTLEALEYLHRQGIVHRDIKGANILISQDSDVKLIDFGVAYAADQAISTDLVGTPFWMAPEVVTQLGSTSASDIWSLGCVVCEYYVGKAPYQSMHPFSALYHIAEDTKVPLPRDLEPDLQSLLADCLQKNPVDRPSAKVLLDHVFFEPYKRQLQQQQVGPMLIRLQDVAPENPELVQQMAVFAEEESDDMWGDIEIDADAFTGDASILNPSLKAPQMLAPSFSTLIDDDLAGLEDLALEFGDDSFDEAGEGEDTLDFDMAVALTSVGVEADDDYDYGNLELPDMDGFGPGFDADVMVSQEHELELSEDHFDDVLENLASIDPIDVGHSVFTDVSVGFNADSESLRQHLAALNGIVSTYPSIRADYEAAFAQYNEAHQKLSLIADPPEDLVASSKQLKEVSDEMKSQLQSVADHASNIMDEVFQLISLRPSLVELFSVYGVAENLMRASTIDDDHVWGRILRIAQFLLSAVFDGDEKKKDAATSEFRRFVTQGLFDFLEKCTSASYIHLSWYSVRLLSQLTRKLSSHSPPQDLVDVQFVLAGTQLRLFENLFYQRNELLSMIALQTLGRLFDALGNHVCALSSFQDERKNLLFNLLLFVRKELLKRRHEFREFLVKNMGKMDRVTDQHRASILNWFSDSAEYQCRVLETFGRPDKRNSLKQLQLAVIVQFWYPQLTFLQGWMDAEDLYHVFSFLPYDAKYFDDLLCSSFKICEAFCLGSPHLIRDLLVSPKKPLLQLSLVINDAKLEKKHAMMILKCYKHLCLQSEVVQPSSQTIREAAMQLVKDFLSVLIPKLGDPDKSIRNICLNSIFLLSRFEGELLCFCIEHGIAPHLLSLLRSDLRSLATPVLLALPGSLRTASPEELPQLVNALLECDILPSLMARLGSKVFQLKAFNALYYLISFAQEEMRQRFAEPQLIQQFESAVTSMLGCFQSTAQGGEMKFIKILCKIIGLVQYTASDDLVCLVVSIINDTSDPSLTLELLTLFKIILSNHIDAKHVIVCSSAYSVISAIHDTSESDFVRDTASDLLTCFIAHGVV